MSAKFTKGPWFYDDGHGLIFGDGNEVICDMMPAGDVAHDANAALVACAPEMYEMLDEISDGLLEAGGYGNCALAKRIETLLAKARGEA